MPQNHRPIGPHSRRFRRGVIGDSVDGRSAIGRLIRRLETELVAHVGGHPTIVERLLIERAIRLYLRLDLLEQKAASGNWTDVDGRTYGGCLNAFRLTCRELGLKGAAPRPEGLAELTARLTRKATP